MAAQELLPVVGAGQRRAGQVPGRARFAAHPAQRVGPVAGAVLVDDGTVHGVAQARRFGRARPLTAMRCTLDFDGFQAPRYRYWPGFAGLQLLDVEILLIDADDRKTERHALVVAEGDAGQRRLAGADGIPAGAHQVHGLAQRGDLHRAVRVVGQQRLAGGGHGAVHHPVVAALFGGKSHGAGKLACRRG